MAERLLACMAKPCKHFPDIGDTSAEPDPFGTMTERDYASTRVATGCAVSDRSIRAVVVGGYPYLTGLGPIVRIEDIPDLPHEMKAHMIAAVHARSAAVDRLIAVEHQHGRDSSHEAPRGRYDRSRSDSAVTKSGADGRSVTVTAPPVAGPVFSAAEIGAARRLLAHLDREQEFCLGRGASDAADSDFPVGTDSDLTELCRKLAQIGVVSALKSPNGLVVRRNAVGASRRR